MRPAPCGVRAARGTGALLVAAALDAALGEPPPRWHPVVAMGRYLDAAGHGVPAGPPARAVLAGGSAWLVGAAGCTVAAVLWQAACRRLPWALGVPAEGAALWTLHSARLLLSEVAAVEAALGHGVERGRAQVARICSRDTAALGGTDVRATALESRAENLADSVVAPLLAHAVAGLPGAAAYRYANTADAMWGYRDARWLHAGRVAARADDVLNLVPARVTAVLLEPRLLVRTRLLHAVRAQAAATPSPNGGWPMATTAVVLGVRLAKPGVYTLNPAGREPGPEDTRRALALARRAVALSVVSAALLRCATSLLRGNRRSRWP